MVWYTPSADLAWPFTCALYSLISSSSPSLRLRSFSSAGPQNSMSKSFSSLKMGSQRSLMPAETSSMAWVLMICLRRASSSILHLKRTELRRRFSTSWMTSASLVTLMVALFLMLWRVLCSISIFFLFFRFTSRATTAAMIWAVSLVVSWASSSSCPRQLFRKFCRKVASKSLGWQSLNRLSMNSSVLNRAMKMRSSWNSVESSFRKLSRQSRSVSIQSRKHPMMLRRWLSSMKSMRLSQTPMSKEVLRNSKNWSSTQHFSFQTLLSLIYLPIAAWYSGKCWLLISWFRQYEKGIFRKGLNTESVSYGNDHSVCWPYPVCIKSNLTHLSHTPWPYPAYLTPTPTYHILLCSIQPTSHPHPLITYSLAPTLLLMIEEEEEEPQKVVLLVAVELAGVERVLSFAAYHNTTRTFSLGTFPDNEHYSHLDVLLLQFHPKEEEAQFVVHVVLPELKHEKKKVLDKTSEVETHVLEEKPGRNQLQGALTYLLKMPLNIYNKELEEPRGRAALERLLEVIDLEREAGNKNQFELKLVKLNSCMLLDSATTNALQVFGKEMERKVLSGSSTLFQLLNKCKTPFGTRCLKRWMKQPLQQPEDIESRLDRVQFFTANAPLKTLIQNQLKKLPDLDRLYFVFYRVAAGKRMRCEVSDLIKIYRAVETLQELVGSLEQRMAGEPALKQFQEELERNVGIISKISKMIEKGIDMSGSRDSEFFVRPETQASLQAIMRRKKELENEIDKEVFEVAQHLSLEVEKVPSNTHRYVLEANKKLAISKVKETPGYKFLTAKQTKITFITNALSRLCEQLRTVEEEYKAEQQLLLKKMFELVAGYYPVMEQLSAQLAELDVLTTFANLVLTANQQWTRPRLSSSGIVGLQMRHPCLKNCVPNDCDLSGARTVILTGPNMGGKSTYIRTIGVCAYLTHIGAFVPAAEFSTPIIDAIITRVGASDLQVKGISTFMSEMLESSCLLKTATRSSLVLIDELGRGTSTCEGFGVAWAICQYLHSNIGPQCLFATHFHEMTRMAQEIAGVKNMFTSCRVDQGQLILEYKVEEGEMQKSYGIEVMKMLKFPEDVVHTAEAYLECYEQAEEDDEVLQGLTEAQKEQIYSLSCQMEEALSKSHPNTHHEVRNAYKHKIQAVLGQA